MSEQHPEGTTEFEGEMGPSEDLRETQATASDLEEPDFSRLRMARASLDAAFPQE